MDATSYLQEAEKADAEEKRADAGALEANAGLEEAGSRLGRPKKLNPCLRNFFLFQIKILLQISQWLALQKISRD